MIFSSTKYAILLFVILIVSITAPFADNVRETLSELEIARFCSTLEGVIQSMWIGGEGPVEIKLGLPGRAGFENNSMYIETEHARCERMLNTPLFDSYVEFNSSFFIKNVGAGVSLFG